MQWPPALANYVVATDRLRIAPQRPSRNRLAACALYVTAALALMTSALMFGAAMLIAGSLLIAFAAIVGGVVAYQCCGWFDLARRGDSWVFTQQLGRFHRTVVVRDALVRRADIASDFIDPMDGSTGPASVWLSMEGGGHVEVGAHLALARPVLEALRNLLQPPGGARGPFEFPC